MQETRETMEIKWDCTCCDAYYIDMIDAQEIAAMHAIKPMRMWRRGCVTCGRGRAMIIRYICNPTDRENDT